MASSRIIVVIGATGAQGFPIVQALLKPSANGTPSPYKVRAITRDPAHRRAQELKALGVELFKGSFMEFDVVAKALEGAYGAFVNTDGFTVGEMAETFAGIKIYELAKLAGLRHYVYSSLDYAIKKGGWKEEYQCDHFEGKSRVAEFLKQQPNELDDPSGTTWSIITTGPYMQMLNALFAPFKQRPDGTYVFAGAIGDGHMPMLYVEDLGFWVRHVLDNPDKSTTGIELEIASDMVTYPQIVETFTKVTGLPAEYKRLTIDEYFDLFESSTSDGPVASQVKGGTTFKKSFGASYAAWRDDVITRDMDWVRSVHPNSMTLERWMRETKYDGKPYLLLKNIEDAAVVLTPNMPKMIAL